MERGVRSAIDTDLRVVVSARDVEVRSAVVQHIVRAEGQVRGQAGCRKQLHRPVVLAAQYCIVHVIDVRNDVKLSFGRERKTQRTDDVRIVDERLRVRIILLHFVLVRAAYVELLIRPEIHMPPTGDIELEQPSGSEAIPVHRVLEPAQDPDIVRVIGVEGHSDRVIKPEYILDVRRGVSLVYTNRVTAEVRNVEPSVRPELQVIRLIHPPESRSHIVRDICAGGSVQLVDSPLCDV